MHAGAPNVRRSSGGRPEQREVGGGGAVSGGGGVCCLLSLSNCSSCAAPSAFPSRTIASYTLLGAEVSGAGPGASWAGLGCAPTNCSAVRGATRLSSIRMQQAACPVADQQGCNVFKKSHVFLVMSFWSFKK